MKKQWKKEDFHNKYVYLENKEQYDKLTKFLISLGCDLMGDFDWENKSKVGNNLAVSKDNQFFMANHFHTSDYTFKDLQLEPENDYWYVDIREIDAEGRKFYSKNVNHGATLFNNNYYGYWGGFHTCSMNTPSNAKQLTKEQFYQKIGYKEEVKSLVGRYLKALNSHPQCISLEKGDYFFITSDKNGGGLGDCKERNKNGYTWNKAKIGIDWELMPEGFIPPSKEETWIPKKGDWIWATANTRDKVELCQFLQKYDSGAYEALFPSLAGKGTTALCIDVKYISKVRKALPSEIPNQEQSTTMNKEEEKWKVGGYCKLLKDYGNLKQGQTLKIDSFNVNKSIAICQGVYLYTTLNEYGNHECEWIGMESPKTSSTPNLVPGRYYYFKTGNPSVEYWFRFKEIVNDIVYDSGNRSTYTLGWNEHKNNALTRVTEIFTEISESEATQGIVEKKEEGKVPDVTNCKIWIGNNPELSKRVQEKLLELGYSWSGDKKIKYAESASIYTNNPYLSYSNDRGRDFFNRQTNKEIFPKDLGIYLFPTERIEQQKEVIKEVNEPSCTTYWKPQRNVGGYLMGSDPYRTVFNLQNEKIEVGDTVEVTKEVAGNDAKVGVMGVVERIDTTKIPYLIKLPNGQTSWCINAKLISKTHTNTSTYERKPAISLAIELGNESTINVVIPKSPSITLKNIEKEVKINVKIQKTVKI